MKKSNGMGELILPEMIENEKKKSKFKKPNVVLPIIQKDHTSFDLENIHLTLAED